MWDYDKLFAEGNVVGFKNVFIDKCGAYQITKNKELPVEAQSDFGKRWNDFKNYNLARSAIFIQYIIRLDEHGNVVEKLFDREKDMKSETKPMPELKDGMFVTVRSCEDDEDILAFIYNSRVIYQDGDWDEICDIMNEDYSLILEVYSSETLCFKGCEECNLLWRSPNYQSN